MEKWEIFLIRQAKWELDTHSEGSVLNLYLLIHIGINISENLEK